MKTLSDKVIVALTEAARFCGEKKYCYSCEHHYFPHQCHLMKVIDGVGVRVYSYENTEKEDHR